MLLIVILTPADISFPYIGTIYPIMLFASVIGIILFSIVVREERQKNESSLSYEELKIKEFKNEYDEIIEDLRNEIKDLKEEKQK